MALFLQRYRSCFSTTLRLRIAGYPFLLYNKQYATMKVTRVAPKPVESYEEKNIRLNRPLSPHVEIYAMKMQTTLSISHRITGIIMNAWVIMFALGSFLVYPKNYEVLQDFLYAYNIPEPVYYLGKFVLVLPFCYHFSAGCRHLLWDLTGHFLKLPAILTTGYIAIGMTIVTTIFALLLVPPKNNRMMRCAVSERASIDDDKDTETLVKTSEVQPEKPDDKQATRFIGEEYSNNLDPQEERHIEQYTELKPQQKMRTLPKYKTTSVVGKIPVEAEVRFQPPDSKP